MKPAWNKSNNFITCRICKKIFHSAPSNHRKYCSKLCTNIGQTGQKNHLGYKHSEKTKLKMSLIKKGKVCSLEHRIKTSNALKGHKAPGWKGGVCHINALIRSSIEFRLWREAVFARDNWICQKTGIKGGALRPHHIKNFAQHPELRFAIDNGITLSDKSHKEFHKKYGIKNNNQEQLEEFLEGETNE